jgi:hypothetical protein
MRREESVIAVARDTEVPLECERRSAGAKKKRRASMEFLRQERCLPTVPLDTHSLLEISFPSPLEGRYSL